MRVYHPPTEPDSRQGLLALLLGAAYCERSEIVLVTPWLRDLELPAGKMGRHADLLGGQRERVSLVEMLERLIGQHHVTVVVKPPSELVPIGDLRRLADRIRFRRRLLADEDIAGYMVVDEIMERLNDEVERLSAIVLAHEETLRVATRLHRAGADVRYLDRLHAKLLWTPVGVLFGSANFTHAGFGSNEELLVELHGAEEMHGLGAVARQYAERAVAVERYDLFRAWRRAGVTRDEVERYRALLSNGDFERLRHLLDYLSPPRR